MSDFGELKNYIVGAAIKRLSQVECDPKASNQHEINATRMKSFMGEEARSDIETLFIRLDDDIDNVSMSRATASWWFRDRRDQKRGIEYRLYYQNNPAIENANVEDTLVVVKKTDDSLVFVTAPQSTQCELELHELFSGAFGNTFETFDFTENSEPLSITKRHLLELIGIEPEAKFGKNYLGAIEEKFGELTFPKTILFSELARDLAGDLSSYNTADDAIISWWDVEEAMFRQLENEFITEKLQAGFDDADDFLSYSLTVRQRRNSRAGRALENHLAHLFDTKSIDYSWDSKTERNKRPDFIFPSIELYKDYSYPSEQLTMLGVKTSCKDRWRQVLSEADRIKQKHLFTIQPGISSNQTQEMKDSQLQLVVPSPMHSSYTTEQRSWLWDLESFLDKVFNPKRKQ